VFDVIYVVEFFTAFFGCSLLYRNIISLQFANFGTSIFLVCYVPLFCVYPLVGRFLSGGAISVDTRVNQVLTDPLIYCIYQSYCIILLIGCHLVANKRPVACEFSNEKKSCYSSAPVMLLFLLLVGVYLFYYSTGLSVIDLIFVTRFEWFLHKDYSVLLSVLSTYLIGVAPVLIYICVRDDKKSILLISLMVLLFYGILSKDRKWIIYLASGYLAAIFIRGSGRIQVDWKKSTWFFLLCVLLAFWQVLRGTLFSALSEGANDLVQQVLEMLNKLLTRGDVPYYYNASVTAIHMNMNMDFSIPLALVRRQLFFFLPVDMSAGLKIEDISALFSDAVAGEDEIRRGNMPPGLLGLLVLSFGCWFGLLFAFLIPFFLRFCDEIFRRPNGTLGVVLISNFFASSIFMLRGDDSSATYFIASNFVFLYVLKLISSLGSIRERDG
jgi:hypothetical protein